MPRSASRRAARRRPAACRPANRPKPVPRCQELQAPLPMPLAGTAPDYFGTPNWANTPSVRKFVDSAAATGGGRRPTDLGQYLSIANPDKLTYPGSDYYEIALRQYTEKMHSDLPPTKLQGYVQVNNGTNAAGTLNNVAAGADPLSGTEHRRDEGPARPHQIHQQASHRHGWRPLHPGGPQQYGSRDGTLRVMPMMADRRGRRGSHGRDHDDGPPQPAGRGADHAHGLRTRRLQRDVRRGRRARPRPPSRSRSRRIRVVRPRSRPRAWSWRTSPRTARPCICMAASRPGSAMARRTSGSRPRVKTPSTRKVSVSTMFPTCRTRVMGPLTFFYTNQQSARLMFYHDHAWGITRLNVYAGEAAGYLLTDPTEQDLIAARHSAGHRAPPGHPGQDLRGRRPRS